MLKCWANKFTFSGPFSPVSYFLNLLWKSKIKLNTSSTCPRNSISKIQISTLSHCKSIRNVKNGTSLSYSVLNWMKMSPWYFFPISYNNYICKYIQCFCTLPDVIEGIQYKSKFKSTSFPIISFFSCWDFVCMIVGELPKDN